jgi:hypothetical protein
MVDFSHVESLCVGPTPALPQRMATSTEPSPMKSVGRSERVGPHDANITDSIAVVTTWTRPPPDVFIETDIIDYRSHTPV